MPKEIKSGQKMACVSVIASNIGMELAGSVVDIADVLSGKRRKAVV
jgi:hypothetical protein